jgi:hypothetical protein
MEFNFGLNPTPSFFFLRHAGSRMPEPLYEPFGKNQNFVGGQKDFPPFRMIAHRQTSLKKSSCMGFSYISTQSL